MKLKKGKFKKVEKKITQLNNSYNKRIPTAHTKMSSEAGSTQCRGLIEAKENLLKAMNSLGSIENLDHIHKTLRDVYNELEQLHESRRIKESNNLN